MLKSRAALLLVAASLAFSAPASADPTIPGCWGVGQNAYCNATVRVHTAGTGSQPTPVCAYTCVYVGTPTLQGGEVGAQVCLDYTTPQGYPGSTCYGEFYDLQYTVDWVRQTYCDQMYKPPSWCR